jgi:hypothetical protein
MYGSGLCAGALPQRVMISGSWWVPKYIMVCAKFAYGVWQKLAIRVCCCALECSKYANLRGDGFGCKEGATQDLNGCFESYLHLIAGHCQWRTLAMLLDSKRAIH